MNESTRFAGVGALLFAVVFNMVVSSTCVGQEDIRQLVWSAAEALEKGNIPEAEQILKEVAVREDLPVDLKGLVSRLNTNIADIKGGDSSNDSDLASVNSRLEVGKNSGMTTEELERYLESLTNAVHQLFERK